MLKAILPLILILIVIAVVGAVLKKMQGGRGRDDFPLYGKNPLRVRHIPAVSEVKSILGL